MTTILLTFSPFVFLIFGPATISALLLKVPAIDRMTERLLERIER
jgi:hypothetical protein